MKKQLMLAACALVSPAARADLLIDGFTDGGTTISLSQNNMQDVRAASVPGGLRLTYLQINQNPLFTNTSTVRVYNHYFSFGADPLVSAMAQLGYGIGPNGTRNDLNLDLTGESEFVLQFQSNDLSTNTLSIDVGTFGPGGSSSPLIALPGGMVNTTFTVVVPFSSFTGNAHFNDIDTIVLTFRNPGSGDLLLANIATAPEPMSLVVMGAGVLVMFLRPRGR